MKTWIALGLCLLAGPAFAQAGFDPVARGLAAAAMPKTGVGAQSGAFAAIVAAAGSSTTPVGGALNFTSPSSILQISGITSMRSTSPVNEPAYFSGIFAGNSELSTNQFAVGFGPYVLESLNSATPENMAMGPAAAIAITTAGGVNAIGTSACAAQTTNACTALGSDAERDLYTVSGDQDVAVGPGTIADGSDTGDNIAVGVNTLTGAATTLTVGGAAPTPGDVWTFHLTTSNACNGTSLVINCTSGTLPNVVYTVISGDNNSTNLANHFLSALNSGWANSTAVNYTLGDGATEGTHNLFAMQFQIPDATHHPTVLKGHYPGSWFLTVTASCSGTCGETVTIGSGFTGSNIIAVGSYVMGSPTVTNPSQDVFIGSNTAQFYVTNPQYDVGIGGGVLQNLSNGNFLTCLGYLSCNQVTSTSEVTAVGAYAGYQVTGYGNTILGSEAGAGSACITSGQHNLELGDGACVLSPTSSYQMSIKNLIYGAGLSATGSTVSTGSIGIGQTAPGARFDILGTDTSGSTLAFRVQNSTPTTEFSVSDTGVATFGGTVVFASSSSGSSTQTFTNSPCSGLTSEKWIPVQITGQSGTFYIPACQ